MSWRYLGFRYAWAIACHHLIRSSRWSDDEKVTTLFLLGAFISGPYVKAPRSSFRAAQASGAELRRQTLASDEQQPSDPEAI
jgi:hypothetical protein